MLVAANREEVQKLRGTTRIPVVSKGVGHFSSSGGSSSSSSSSCCFCCKNATQIQYKYTKRKTLIKQNKDKLTAAGVQQYE